MIELDFAPRTRAVRIVWLLEGLGLERVDFLPPARRFFAQQTPTGKVPTLEDGDVVTCESGATVEYPLETHADGRLATPVGHTAARRGRRERSGDRRVSGAPRGASRAPEGDLDRVDR